MSVLAKVSALFDASSALKAKEDIDKLKNASPEAASALGKLEEAVSMLSNPLVLMGTALVAGVGYMAKLGFEAINTADNLRDMAIGTGRTIAELQALQSMAEKSGSSLEALQGGLDFISRGLTKGEEDTQKFTKALEYFGVSQRDANGQLKDAATLAEEVAKAYVETEDSASKQAAAADALGRSYKSLVPAYLELNKKQEEQNYLMEVGAIVTQEQADASDEYNDTMHDVHSILQGVGNYAAKTFLPLLQGIASQLKESATNGGLLNAAINILKVAFDGLTIVAKGVFSVLIGIDTVFQAVGKTAGAFVAIIERLASGDIRGAKTIWTEMGKDIDEVFQKGGERINKMFTDIGEGAKKADEEVKKVGRGDYRSTTDKKEKELKLKVEKDPVEEANKALLQLIDSMTTANKLAETNSIEMATASKLATERYTAGNSALKDQVMLLAKQADALKENKELEQSLKDLQKQTAGIVEGLEDELKARTMTTQEYRKYVLLKQLDVATEEKLQQLNKNVSGYEERRTAILEEQRKAREDITAATERSAAADMDWTTGAKEAFVRYKEEVNDVASATRNALTSAFQGAEDALVKFVMTGKFDFKSLADSIMADITRMAIRAAIVKPLLAYFGMGFAQGDAFSNGATVPFASGDVLTSATTFPMANGAVGQAGEAGPEAIMPLTRMPNGRLGVTAEAGGGAASILNVGGIHVNFNGGGSGGGSPEDQQKMAKMVGDTVELRLKALMNKEMANARRPGNQFNPTPVKVVF